MKIVIREYVTAVVVAVRRRVTDSEI